MVAPVLGLPALLKAIATIGVGGAVGYKAQKDLQPVIKQLKASPEDMDSSELRMLRALLLPNQAVASELKENISEFGLKVPGVIAPDADEMEKVRQDIEKNLKPGETKKVDIPLTTGGTEPPKIDTTETFPAPEEKLPILESFPDQSEKINIPIITYYNKDDELIKEGLGRYEEVYSEQDFKTANKNSPELSVKNNKKIVEADKHFGAYALDRDFDTTRLIYLTPKQYLNLSNDFNENSDWSKARIDYLTEKLKQGKEMGEIPALFVGKEGNNYIVRGHEGRHRASAFLNAGYDKIPVRIEGISKEKGSDVENKLYTATPESNVGKQLYSKEFANFIPEKIISERIRGDRSLSGETDFTVELKPDDFFDVITKEKLFSKPEAPAIIGTKAIEGGKQIRDITAGVSAQKEQVPELLEQGKLAMPIKKFFEDDNQVVNYKIGDTIGKYGQDVERSLDIEANVKKDFNIDKFSEVIKDRAKEFNQDAVFVAESVSPDFEGANIGIDLDFGSNLKMQDAINVSNAISRVAEIDGFTFKIKNFDSSNSSLYLPQTPKDQELTKETLKKYPLTEDIRQAGFIMPDGKMLNFNLRGGNLRDTEHRRVGFLVEEGYDGQDFGPMYDWMIRTGGVRVTGNKNRLFAELVGRPTPTQINKIVEEYNTNRDQYDSMIIAVTVPGVGGQGQLAPRQDFGGVTGLNTIFANDLRKATFRLPAENFYEVNGEEANAADILRRIKSADVVGKTFTGVRQLNIPEFSNISAKEAFDKITNLNNNFEEIKESMLIETLDKPKVKFYNTKVFTKGKDY